MVALSSSSLPLSFIFFPRYLSAIISSCKKNVVVVVVVVEYVENKDHQRKKKLAMEKNEKENDHKLD